MVRWMLATAGDGDSQPGRSGSGLLVRQRHDCLAIRHQGLDRAASPTHLSALPCTFLESRKRGVAYQRPDRDAYFARDAGLQPRKTLEVPERLLDEELIAIDGGQVELMLGPELEAEVAETLPAASIVVVAFGLCAQRVAPGRPWRRRPAPLRPLVQW